MLQKHSHTSLFSFGGGEVKQRPAVGVTDLGRVALFQHPPDGAHVPGRHRSLDLQLLVKLWVPPAVMVQHPSQKNNSLRYTAQQELTRKHQCFVC